MNKPKYHYRIVHDWLNKHYGKANKCENPLCKNNGKRFEYALKKDYQHEKNRDNYIMLCSSCHKKYDLTEEQIERLSQFAGKYNKYLKLGPIAKRKSVILLPDNILFESGRELADYLGVTKSAIYMVLSGKRKSILGYKVKYADS